MNDLAPMTPEELAKLKEAKPNAPELRFLTPAELRESTPEEPAWLWNGYIAPNTVTLVAGKPKVGKSTLAMALCSAIGMGAEKFLGRTIKGAPVLYISEESAPTLIHKLPEGDVRILTRDNAWPRPTWLELIAAAQAEADRFDAGLLVIDTFSFWGQLVAEREKDAGAVQGAMEPLIAATSEGLAVLLVHHQRKGGGEEGEGVRGSSALAGAVDIVLELERRPAEKKRKADPRQRLLLALSRYPQTPTLLMIDRDPATEGWGVIGEGTERGEAREIGDRAALLTALEDGAESTRIELERATGVNWQRLGSIVDRLLEEGTIARLGAGKKGDPHRFKFLSRNAVQTARQKRTERGHREVSVSVRPRRGPETETSNTESVQKPLDSTLEDWVLDDPDGVAQAVDGTWERTWED